MTDALTKYLQRAAELDFEWGVHDCAIFAAGWVDIECGTNFVQYIKEEFPYHDKRSAISLFEGDSLVHRVRDLIGPECDRADVGRGDLAITGTTHRKRLAIVVPPVVLSPAARGLAGVGLNQILHCWSLASCRRP